MKKESEKSVNRKLDDESIVKASESSADSKTSSIKSSQKAETEEINWLNLTQQKRANTLREMRVLGWIVPILMVLLCLLFMFFLGSWSWHFLTPKCWHWLGSAQIDKIESIIFSGTLGATASIYFQSKINKDPTSSDRASRFG